MQMQLRTRYRRGWLLGLAVCMGLLVLTGLAGATLGRYVVDSRASAAETVVSEGDYVRVFEDGAPYDDPVWGAYYVAYVGSASMVDVKADMAAGKLAGVAPETGLTTTYKLFENLHAHVQRVFLPDVSGFTAHGAAPGAVSAAIDPLTFGSEGPGHAVQVVYRDATGADRTGDLASSPAAAQTLAYLYLEDALLEDAPSGKSYRGPAPNVYVSSEVGSLSRLFSGNTALENVLFCDEAPTSWADLSETFKGCTSLVGLENAQAAFSQALGMAGAFWGCSSLTSLPDGFAFPAGATDLSHVFTGCSSLASVPSDLRIPAATTTVEGLFDGCDALAEVPSGLFSAATSLENMSAALRGCANVSGEFFVARTVTAIDGCFDGAGAAAAPCFDADGARVEADARHAVVAWYYDDAAPAVASYADALGKDGKAVMLPLVWERAYVADGSAPYNDDDGLGPYYIRYIGNADTVDVSQHMNPAGEILGTKIATTYRMFENARPNLKTVITPDVSGLAAFDAATGSLGSAPALDALTFGGASPDHFIELVYRDAAGGDHTAEVPCANAQPYLYLDRTVMTYDSSSNAYSYEGAVPHVYLSKEIPTLEAVLYDNTSVVSAAIDRAYNDDWTGMRTTFFGCTSLERLSPYFGVPPESVDMVGTFYNCTSLVSLPEGFVLPDIVQYMDQMFYNCSSLVSLPTNFNVSRDCLELFSTFDGCSSLQRLPEGFSIPAGVNDVEYMFRYCNRLEALPDDLAIPSPVTDARFAFYACTSIKTVPAGLLANATSLTEMGAMFSQCTSLETVPDGFKLPPSTTNAASFFSNCRSLSYVPGDFFERTSRQFNAQGFSVIARSSRAI